MRVLRWYEKNPRDRLVGQATLSDVGLPELQRLFDISVDDQMYDCYPVAQKHKEYLEQHVDTEINLSKYDYFIECDAVT